MDLNTLMPREEAMVMSESLVYTVCRTNFIVDLTSHHTFQHFVSIRKLSVEILDSYPR